MSFFNIPYINYNRITDPAIPHPIKPFLASEPCMPRIIKVNIPNPKKVVHVFIFPPAGLCMLETPAPICKAIYSAKT